MKYILKIYDRADVFRSLSSHISVGKAVKKGYKEIGSSGTFILYPKGCGSGVYVGRPKDAEIIDMKGLVNLATELMIELTGNSCMNGD